MARILAEGAVEIVPESTGFAQELKSDISRDLTAATAGQDRTVRIRVTTDADRAEAQIRGALTRVQSTIDQIVTRTRTRAQALYQFLEQRVVIRLANKIREQTEKTLGRVKLLMEPFWAYMRQRLDVLRRGWQGLRETVERGADAVADRWRRSMAVLSAQMSRVRQLGQRMFVGLADAGEPHLARARRAVETLQFPFRVVRAYGVGTFRVIGDAATSAGQRIGAAFTSGFGRAMRPMRDFRGGMRDVMSALDEGATKSTKFGALTRLAMIRAGVAVMDAARRFGDFGERVSGGVGLVTRDLSNLVGGVRLVGRGFSAFGRIVGGVGGLLSGFRQGTENVTAALGGMKSMAGSVLSTIVSFTTKLLLYGAVAGAVTFAVGALGAAFVGLPAIVGAAVASFTVFKLGMDGIKRAYETGLKPSLNALKSQVEDVFERTLTPAFQRLGRDLVPQITDSMKGLAQAFADGGVAIIDMVNRGDNIARINALVNNLAGEVRGQLTPALQNVIQAFFNIGASGSILRDMIGIFADLTNRTADWLNEMLRSGEAERAVSNLRGVLDSVVALIYRLLTAAVQFFNAAAPGFRSLLDSIRPSESVMRKLGEAFGDAAQAAGDLLRSIPPETWDAIADAAKRLGDKLVEIANNKDFQSFVQALVDILPRLIDGFTRFVGIIEKLAGLRTAVNDFFAPLTDTLDNILRPLGLASDGFGKVGDSASTAGGQVESGFVPPIETLPGKTDAAFEGVQRAADKLEPLPGTALAAGQGTADNLMNNLTPLPGQADAAFGGVNAAGDKLQPLPGTAAAAAQAAQQGIDAGLAPMPGTADAAFQGVTDAAQRGMDAAASAAETGAGRVRDSLQNGLKAASDAASTAMTSIGDVVEERMQAAGASAEVGGQRIGDGVRSGADAAASAAQAAMPRVADAVRSAMDGAASAAEGGGRRVADAVRAAGDAAAGAMEGAMPRVADSVSRAMDASASAAESGGRRIADGLRASGDAAAASVQAAMTKVSTAVDQGMQRATQAATRGGQQIQQALQQAMNRVVQVTDQSWQRIVQAFTRGGQQAVASARNTGGQVVAAFQSQAGPMFAAGQSLIQRLTAGMIAQGAAATAAAARIAASIKAQFPSSPAKEGPLSGAGDPLRSGGVIVARLAAGMAGNAAAVTAAMQPILARLVAQVNSTAANPMVDAAREILARIQSRGQMFEDLTWKGASANVGRYNDDLLNLQQRSGVRDTRAFLEDYIRRNTAQQAAPAGGGGDGVLGRLDMLIAELRGLRGDAVAHGYGPDMLDRLDQVVAALSGRSGTAASRAAGARDLSELGAFP